jgi:hypothetical protein
LLFAAEPDWEARGPLLWLTDDEVKAKETTSQTTMLIYIHEQSQAAFLDRPLGVYKAHSDIRMRVRNRTRTSKRKERKD